MMFELLSENNYDELTVEVNVDITKQYVNVSKHKRILTPVINETITLYVNEIRLNEDAGEVFVVTEFFNSITHQGKFPMFTCSCGIFGCGGFYVNVNYKNKCVMWGTEQATYKKSLFSKGNIQLVALELINKLAEFNDLRKEHGLQTYYNIDDYKAKLEVFLNQKAND